MATWNDFDFDSKLAELVELERQERRVSDLRNKLHARLDAFPNEVMARREREVSAERQALHQRIDRLRGQLRPMLARVPE